MAGSIRRIIPNTLSYSCEFSSPFNSDRNAASESSGFSGDDSSLASSSIVFDLREDFESDKTVQSYELHEMCANSESAIRLEPAPLDFSVNSEKNSVSSVLAIPSDDLGAERITTRVSDLVESLVGPSLMPSLSKRIVRSSNSTKPSSTATSAVSSPRQQDTKPVLRQAIPKVFPVSRTPPKKASRRAQPKSVVPEQRRPLRIHNQKVESPFVPFGEVVKTNISSSSTFKCPDSWIPNHQCDDFCYSSFATSSKPPRPRAFTSFPK
jgi:hypothetical protein